MQDDFAAKVETEFGRMLVVKMGAEEA